MDHTHPHTHTRRAAVLGDTARRRARRVGVLSSIAVLLFAAACSPKGRGDGDDDEASESTAQAQKEQQAQQPAAQKNSAAYDWKQVDQAIGKSGTPQPGDVYKVSFPRSDLQVTADGVPVKPALALGGWVAFRQTGNDQATAMGDLVLTEDEVAPVMTKLQEGGVQQTALHNHLLHESPRVMYMHIDATGDPAKIASAIRAALALSKTPMQAPAAPAAGANGGAPAAIGIDTAAIARALGHAGKVNGGVYQVSVPRADRVTMDGMEVPPSMGVAISMNFQPTGGGKAAATGDFVLVGSEVNPVIQALRQNGIQVTALHSHMLMESPRLFFMHFWANEDAARLAAGLRAALDKINTQKGTT